MLPLELSRNVSRRSWRSLCLVAEVKASSSSARAHTLPLRPVARLAQDEESGRACGEAGSRGGLGM